MDDKAKQDLVNILDQKFNEQGKALEKKLDEQFEEKFINLFNDGFTAVVLPQIERIDTRLDSVDARFDSIDTRLDSVENRLDSLDRKVDRMLDNQLGQDTKIKRLEKAYLSS